jgi:hypothetical protein
MKRARSRSVTTLFLLGLILAACATGIRSQTAFDAEEPVCRGNIDACFRRCRGEHDHKSCDVLTVLFAEGDPVARKTLGGGDASAWWLREPLTDMCRVGRVDRACRALDTVARAPVPTTTASSAEPPAPLVASVVPDLPQRSPGGHLAVPVPARHVPDVDGVVLLLRW